MLIDQYGSKLGSQFGSSAVHRGLAGDNFRQDKV
jgi:hypothetical protein